MTEQAMTGLDVDLSDAQVQGFHEHGYLSVDRITTPDEVERLKVVYEEVFRTKETLGLPYRNAGPDGEATLMQVHSVERKFPELFETSFFRNARRAASRLLDVAESEVTAYCHMLYKVPQVGAVTPWHQDEPTWPQNHLFVYHALNCWMPLDPVTVESGCMQFIPRPIRDETFLPHVLRDKESGVLVAEDVDDSSAVACPIPAGGATFHFCRTPHYSAPNTTDQPRRALIFVFHSVPKRVRLPKALAS